MAALYSVFLNGNFLADCPDSGKKCGVHFDCKFLPGELWAKFVLLNTQNSF